MSELPVKTTFPKFNSDAFTSVSFQALKSESKNSAGQNSTSYVKISCCSLARQPLGGIQTAHVKRAICQTTGDHNTVVHFSYDDDKNAQLNNCLRRLKRNEKFQKLARRKINKYSKK
jgi:hypothetical protein